MSAEVVIAVMARDAANVAKLSSMVSRYGEAVLVAADNSMVPWERKAARLLREFCAYEAAANR
jgi:hypothetical protein